MAAAVLCAGIMVVWAACSQPTGGGGGGGGGPVTNTTTSTAKETITVSETMAGVDNSINASGATNGITYSLKNSKLTMNFPKNPTGLSSVSGSLVAAPSVSAANARAAHFSNPQARILHRASFPLPSISKNLARVKITTVGDIKTYWIIVYVYVSADVTISSDTETFPDPGDGYSVIVPAYSMALKKGWQLCEMKKVFNNTQHTQTITYLIVANSDIPWVLTTESFGN
jgi:hypothetical protein